ncbi:HU family DNA-binding protein [uncultured Bacteroides sp.]|uniref:HU family DNA-binding protein n=1 Tax=uncultured Bacteroides sp. TaxID=162156 RepID=UPI002587C253|nr:HU family DNA-binding protein [uncultured Bacteroides sp.]
MMQKYIIMSRKNLLKPDEAPKYYAVARSGRKVTVKEVCKRISERSSYSKGELEGCIGEFLLEIVNVLEEGNIVQMGDLGNFRMNIKTGIPTETVKEFNASCIEKGKVLFYPGNDLRKLCKTMDYTLYKSDAKPDAGDEPLPDDGGGNQSGSGNDGETPDPAA